MKTLQQYLIPFALMVSIGAVSATELTKEKAAELHRQLKPSDDELWRTIPWKIRLLDAQQQAAKERKPIFIWAMDGHPLGCT